MKKKINLDLMKKFQFIPYNIFSRYSNSFDAQNTY